ncbi:MAG: undecaprenyl-phosphate glucose phosphotransferase [Pseudomonadota bacterium]
MTVPHTKTDGLTVTTQDQMDIAANEPASPLELAVGGDEDTPLHSDIADGVRQRTRLTRELFGDMVQIADFLLIIGAAMIVAHFYHNYLIIADYEFQQYATAGIIGATGFTALSRRDGFYDFDRLISGRNAIRLMLTQFLMVVFGLLAFAFALKISDDFSRVWLGGWIMLSVVALALVRVIAAISLQRTRAGDGVFSRRVGVVGANQVGLKFAERASVSEEPITIVGVYDLESQRRGVIDGRFAGGNLDDLVRAARNDEVDDIIIASDSLQDEDLKRLVRRLSTLPVSIALSPNEAWLDHAGGEMTSYAGAPVLNLYRRPLEGWGGFFKMLEDRILGTLILLAISPLMLAIALAVKLQGKGPILFAQQRHGFNNEVFKIYKFRTMTVAEDGDVVTQAQKNDQRITPLGGFLRRYSLDELPQLLNVVKGDMSLVGPRPHALAHNHQYARTVENYSGRHKVKPGITGWAQVNGYRGETSENEMMADRVRYDLAYIDNWSLFFDLKILFLTIFAVLFPKNAY